MTAEKKKKNKFLERLRTKYRLVIIDDNSLEEKISFRLSRMNVFVVFGLISIFLIFITTLIIAFTPLREYIPGYGSFQSDRTLRELVIKTDSLEESMQQKDLYLYNIKNIIEGKEMVDSFPEKPVSSSNKYGNITIKKSLEDSLLRLEMEKQDQYNLAVSQETETASVTSISNLFFLLHLKGLSPMRTILRVSIMELISLQKKMLQ